MKTTKGIHVERGAALLEYYLGKSLLLLQMNSHLKLHNPRFRNNNNKHTKNPQACVTATQEGVLFWLIATGHHFSSF